MSARRIFELLRRAAGDPGAMVSRLAPRVRDPRSGEEWTTLVAHELRQPLGTMTLALGVLDSCEEPRLASAVRRLRASLRKLDRLVDDLVDDAAIRSGKFTVAPRRVDLGALVARALADTEHLTGGRTITLGCPPAPLLVDADPCRIEQVVANLISNAVKYGARNSPVTLRVERLDAEALTTVTNVGDGPSVEESARIFERAYRTPRGRASGRAGLGLGLYVARTIVLAHGGRIGVGCRGGETTFWFSIPLPRDDSSVVAATV